MDSFRSQNECLDHEDIKAAWAFLQSTTSPHYAMYNCTENAGCSRLHKHIQIIPKPEASGSEFRFFPDISYSEASIPYVHFVHRFPADGTVDSLSILNVYLDLLKSCRRVLGIREDDKKSLCPHNVILVKEWVAIIPRRQGSYQDVGANAAGMLGMPTISNNMLFKKWKEIGPIKILYKLGVPIHNS